MNKPEQLKEPIPLGYGLADARIDECHTYVVSRFKEGHSVKMTIINPDIDPYNLISKYGNSCIVEDTGNYSKRLEFKSFALFKPLGGKEFKGVFLVDIFRFYNFD